MFFVNIGIDKVCFKCSVHRVPGRVRSKFIWRRLFRLFSHTSSSINNRNIHRSQRIWVVRRPHALGRSIVVLGQHSRMGLVDSIHHHHRRSFVPCGYQGICPQRGHHQRAELRRPEHRRPTGQHQWWPCQWGLLWGGWCWAVPPWWSNTECKGKEDNLNESKSRIKVTGTYGKLVEMHCAWGGWLEGRWIHTRTKYQNQKANGEEGTEWMAMVSSFYTLPQRTRTCKGNLSNFRLIKCLIKMGYEIKEHWKHIVKWKRKLSWKRVAARQELVLILLDFSVVCWKCEEWKVQHVFALLLHFFTLGIQRTNTHIWNGIKWKQSTIWERRVKTTKWWTTLLQLIARIHSRTNFLPADKISYNVLEYSNLSFYFLGFWCFSNTKKNRSFESIKQEFSFRDFIEKIQLFRFRFSPWQQHSHFLNNKKSWVFSVSSSLS